MTNDTTEQMLPIRPGMDVYSTYQNQYIGSVIAVRHGTVIEGRQPRPEGGQNPTGSEQSPPTARIAQEQGGPTTVTDSRQRHVLGEELGPVSTMATGNSGPRRQSADEAYATTPGRIQSTTPAVVSFTVRPGRLNLGPLSRPLYVPASAVRAISMERVVLDVQRDQIPASWRTSPSK